MGIDLRELQEWIRTDDGAAWMESQKAPLVAKRDELLEALRQSNGKASEQAQRAADLERLLGEERASIARVVVDDALAGILKGKRVMEPAIPGVVAELREAYGLNVSANGTERKATGTIRGADGSTRAASLEEVVGEWSKTPAAQKVILVPPSSGGGSPGPGPVSGGFTRDAIAKMSPREVADNFDRPEFQAALSGMNGA